MATLCVAVSVGQSKVKWAKDVLEAIFTRNRKSYVESNVFPVFLKRAFMADSWNLPRRAGFFSRQPHASSHPFSSLTSGYKDSYLPPQHSRMQHFSPNIPKICFYHNTYTPCTQWMDSNTIKLSIVGVCYMKFCLYPSSPN